MEVRSFKVRAAAQHVRVLAVDTDGERGRDLEGDAAQAVIDAAAPLMAALAAQLGAPPQSLSYSGDEDTLRLAPPPGVDVDPAGLTLRGDALAPHADALRSIARAIRDALRRLAGDAPADPSESRDPNDPEFWDSMYRRGFTGWELGRAAPPIARFFAANSPAGKRALVVGCGRGNEARMLAELGAEVVAIDISTTAIAQAEALPSPRPVDWRVANVFDLRGQAPA
ncbi:MAG: methyltransferase domain-containing protein, partial [Nannocystaceae bacterium]